MSAVLCDYCGSPAELVRGEALYPWRPELHEKLFWRCALCVAWVGVHKGGTQPFGRLANAALRSKKQAAHAVFDPLWMAKMERNGMSKHIARRSAYMWLAAQLALPVKETHIGMFDEPLCERVIEICRPYAERLKYR